MVCTYNSKTKFRVQLDFTCSSDWADFTSEWKGNRKRKLVSTKEKPPKPAKPTNKNSKPRHEPKKRLCLKSYETKSAGAVSRISFKPELAESDCLPQKETVKCKVVSFCGVGTKFCMVSELRTQSVPSRNDVWSDDWDQDLQTSRSDKSGNSTINLDSGRKQSTFHKEQLLLQLHERSASLVKYLFVRSDQIRSTQLTVDSISLPIRPHHNCRPSPCMPGGRIKHTIVPPKDPTMYSGDYVGALIPNTGRPLGYGLFGSPSDNIKIPHKTLEIPDLDTPSKIILPPVDRTRAGPTHLRCSENEKVQDKSYIKSVSQLVGMLCIEPRNPLLPPQAIQKWLDTS